MFILLVKKEFSILSCAKQIYKLIPFFSSYNHYNVAYG